MTNAVKNISAEDKKVLRKVFKRSMFIGCSYNYERMQSLGYLYAMIPAIKAYYKDEEDRKEAYKRHFELFNTTPHICSFIMGLSTAMEKEKANNEDFDTTSINSVKVSLMGPLAGIGDSLFWGTLRIIAAGIGISLAEQGNILGPLLFLLIFNIPHYIVRYLGTMYGFGLGNGFLQKAYESGAMAFVIKAANIVGLMVVGAMTCSMVKITSPLILNLGGSELIIQDILNQIFPNLLPLVLTFCTFNFIKKGKSVNAILVALLVLGVLGRVVGIL